MNIPHPIRDRLKQIADDHRAQLIAEVMRRGNASHAEAASAVAKLESAHPLLDLLAGVDWAKVIEMVMALLPLFLAKSPVAATAVEQVYGTEV